MDEIEMGQEQDYVHTCGGCGERCSGANFCEWCGTSNRRKCGFATDSVDGAPHRGNDDTIRVGTDEKPVNDCYCGGGCGGGCGDCR